ncbi:MAG: tetratricopeptide repeat protein [Vicinamibacterales bacterium]
MARSGKLRAAAAIVAVLVLAGCANNRAYRRGQQAADAQQWDEAVEYYRQALQNAPDKPEYKIALERAMQAAGSFHIARGRTYETEGRPDDALREYRKAIEYDPSNRSVAARAAELDRELREKVEASRPRPAIDVMREQVRRNSPEPVLSPTSKEPLNLRFSNTSLRDLLNFIGNSTGINITYDRDFQDRSVSVQLEGVTLDQALQQVMLANQIFYKVLNERTIIVATDNTAKRQQYEEQVIKTFFISHADATELAQLVNTVILAPQMAIQPRIAPNKTANTITVRASAPVVEIVDQIIKINDKPRAEVVIDVQILEVSRERAKRFGLNLTDYALGGIFSPEQAPGGSSTTTGTGGAATTTTSGSGTAPSNVGSPPVFNANTISTGISAADFYMAVPAAIVRFLESDSHTKTVAKPQLRGTEGQKVTLNLGEEVPVPSTTFTPIATGGASANPLTSFTYRPIGVIVEMTPRVTYEGDIVMDLTLENSARGQDSNIAGQVLPAFASRKVTTRLRLRDGESNLLAGLLREDERRSLRGFPGILRMPILQQLFADNDQNIRQTDIVMLLTPRVVRSHQLTTNDLSPIYIGTQANMAPGGPPPIFGGAAAATPQPGPAAPAAPAVAPGTPMIPPGSSPIPGMTTAPAPPPAAAAAPPPLQTQPPQLQTQPPPASPESVAPAPAAPAATAPPTFPGLQPVPQQGAASAGTTPPNPFAAPPSAAPATVLASPPGTDFRVGGGPYLVPIAVSGASRLSTISLSITYNPAVLKVRTVQEGSLMRQGGQATFTQKIDAAAGRVDIVVVRPGDVLGVSGTGVVGAVLFDAVAPGGSPIGLSGAGTLVGNAPAPLQFKPVAVTVK